MKKVLLLTIGILSIYISNAQFTASQKLIGPSLGLSINNNSSNNDFTLSNPSDSKTNSLSLNIGISSIKMKSATKGTGFTFSYDFSHSNYEYKYINITPIESTTNKNNMHDFSFGFVQRNFIQIKPKFNFFYDAGIAAMAGFGNANYTSIAVSGTNRKTGVVKLK